MKRQIDLKKAAEDESFGALAVASDPKHRNARATGQGFTPAQNRAAADLARNSTHMPSDPLPRDNSDDISTFIRVSPNESDRLLAFLHSKAVGAAKHWGISNTINPHDVQQLMKLPAPMLLVYGASRAVAAAFNAYAEAHKTTLKIIRYSKGAIEIEATNITPEQLKTLENFDVLKFESKDSTRKPE